MTQSKKALQEIKELIAQYIEELPEDELKYLSRGLKKEHRIAPFTILPKVHKTPMATRPIVRDVNTATSFLSKLSDSYLQKVVHLCPGYLKDSQTLV